jgi:hypothetical protein
VIVGRNFPKRKLMKKNYFDLHLEIEGRWYAADAGV